MGTSGSKEVIKKKSVHYDAFEANLPSTWVRGKTADALAHFDRASVIATAGQDLFTMSVAGNLRSRLNAARSREEVTVVDDQYGCPTHAPALAAALLEIAQVACAPGFAGWGAYHLAGAGETDRASMTRAIYAESARHGGA